MSGASLTVRQLDRAGWAAGATLAARAFHGEEFVIGMFGAEPLARFVAVHHLYRHETWDSEAIHLGAFVGDVLVGVVRASPSGACHVCMHVDADRPPADPVLAADWADRKRVV